jgi:polyisoprenoid-binding protein YceI
MKTLARWMGVVVLLATAGTGAALAQHQIFHINPARSEAHFTFEGSNPAITGTFQVAQSAIEFKEHDPDMGGSVILKAATEKSGKDSRDKAIQTQVLNAREFGDIIFTPKSYIGHVDVSDGGSVVQVTGTLMLHGQPHEITVPVAVQSNGNEFMAHIKLVVPYVQWGLKDLSGLDIQAGQKVDVELKLVGYVSPEN